MNLSCVCYFNHCYCVKENSFWLLLSGLSLSLECSLCLLHCGHCLHIQKWCYLYIILHLND